ncbi:MAG: hypothetical protein ACLPY1_03525 [Terracidiphilus sp.]
MSQPSPAATGQPSTNSPARNSAVQRCCAARDRSLEDSRAGNVGKSEARERSQQAYRDALPDLAGYENIRDFVACISHGLLTGDISAINSPTYLYAAQVAISALRLEPKEKKQTAA